MSCGLVQRRFLRCPFIAIIHARYVCVARSSFTRPAASRKSCCCAAASAASSALGAGGAGVSSTGSPFSCWVTKSFSYSQSSSMASPERPARPVRPTRCTYTSRVPGVPTCRTRLTSG